MDINKVWLSGLVISDPIYSTKGFKTASTIFQMEVHERYVDRHGQEKTRPSVFMIESLGRSAEKVYNTVRKGSRYTVDGYLRAEPGVGSNNDERVPDMILVRSFAIHPDISLDAFKYKEGLKKAKEILNGCANLEAAKEKLEELIN